MKKLLFYLLLPLLISHQTMTASFDFGRIIEVTHTPPQPQVITMLVLANLYAATNFVRAVATIKYGTWGGMFKELLNSMEFKTIGFTATTTALSTFALMNIVRKTINTSGKLAWIVPPLYGAVYTLLYSHLHSKPLALDASTLGSFALGSLITIPGFAFADWLAGSR